MTQTSYAILTRTGSSLLAQAVANDAPLSLTKIVIGQGTTTPTGSETALYDPLVTKDIADYGVSDSDSSTFWFTCFIPADEGPYSISEIGLLSADGSLIAIGHMDPAISKPVPSSGQTIDMVLGLYLKIDTASSITVSVADAESVSLSSMDTLPWLPVQSITEKAPPDTVTNGVVYYVPTGATGAWENLVGKLVQKATAGWLAVSPVEGHGIGLPDGTIYQYVSGAYTRVSAKLAEITNEASARESADKAISDQFLNYYTKTGSDARYLPLTGGTVDYLNSNGDIKIKTGKWLYADTLKDNGAGTISVNSPISGSGSATFKGSVRSSLNSGWNGGTATGAYRWGAPLYIGPVNSADASTGQFLAGMQFGDIVGDQNNSQSGLCLFLYAADGTRTNYYFSNSGQIMADKMGQYAPKNWVLSQNYVNSTVGSTDYQVAAMGVQASTGLLWVRTGDDWRYFIPLDQIQTLYSQKSQITTFAPITSSWSVTAPSWATRIEIIAVGGGGGGSSCKASGSTPTSATLSGGGGGSGQYVRGSFPVASGNAVSFTIGSGGATEANGGTTSASVAGSTVISANGGGRSYFPSVGVSAGGAGGAGGFGGNILTVSGNDGGDGQNGNIVTTGGVGGAGPWGGAGRGGALGGISANGYGAGGGGSYDGTYSGNYYAGGSGYQGIILYRFLP